MSYTGNGPIPGMTIEQQRACEAMCKLAREPSWHDGLMRNVAAALPGEPPWTNADVQAAIVSVAQSHGIALPFFP